MSSKDRDSVKYNVVYLKETNKKRKAYMDGFLIKSTRTNNVQYVTILDESSKVVWANSYKGEILADVELKIGPYNVLIENLFDVNSSDQNIDTSNQLPEEKYRPSVSQIKRPCFEKTSDETTVENLDKIPTLELSLLKFMKPHQITGAEFIFECLYGCNNIKKKEDNILTDKGKLEYNSDNDCDSDFVYVPDKLSHSKNFSCESSKVRGAILADEMGLGKSLTILAVIWSIIKQKNCKGVIIVPSSLVGNWENECKKWLKNKITLISVRSGAGVSAEESINAFKLSHISISPIMIISYDMFRNNINRINEVPKLDILVCDEGHRLKNIDSTKTTTALCNCKATKRIILTGTPIQNDLTELFSIVNFVRPGYLGTIDDFKRRFEAPILQSKEENISKYVIERGKVAFTELQDHLGNIMIRRLQSDLLNHLPERNEFLVKCYLNCSQKNEYREIVKEIYRSIDRIAPCKDNLDSFLLDLDTDSNESHSQCDQSSSQFISSHYILPGILKLRKVCNFIDDVAITKTNSLLTDDDHRSSSFFEKSAKLLVLDSFLSRLKVSSPGDKVVVVSNFTSMLSQVQHLASIRSWKFLQLDGSVPVKNRQYLIDRFNNSDTGEYGTFLFLLSAKAGGVGINLIGANHLILLDADWNPATDIQAMARIWREGQRKAVFIYRFMSVGTIEQSIIGRQNKKMSLESIVNKKAEIETETLDNLDDEKEDLSDDLKKLTVEELENLVLPAYDSSTSSSSSVEIDQNNIMQKSISELGNKIAILELLCATGKF